MALPLSLDHPSNESRMAGTAGGVVGLVNGYSSSPSVSQAVRNGTSAQELIKPEQVLHVHQRHLGWLGRNNSPCVELVLNVEFVALALLQDAEQDFAAHLGSDMYAVLVVDLRAYSFS